MRVFLLVAAVAASSPLNAAGPEPNRIVYWGNVKTAAAVRVMNVPDAEKKAEEQVKKLGGEGWVMLENSTKPGFGAAICLREGKSLRFYTAHGYPSSKDAIVAAKAKAGGRGVFCSKALWKVNEIADGKEGEPTLVDRAKAEVYKRTVKEGAECVKQAPATRFSGKTEESSASEKAAASCPSNLEKGLLDTELVCMCVRG